MVRAWRVGVLAMVAWLAVCAGCAEQKAASKPPAPAAPTAAPPSEPRTSVETPAPARPTTPPTVAAPPGPPPSPSATAEPGQTSPPVAAVRPPPRLEEFVDEPALKDVFFERGHVELGPVGVSIMRDNAHWLSENPGYLVLIEGHTDFTGTHDENLVVAERRANAARNILTNDGVQESRITVVSYGSDRPVCREKTASCGAKNRRVHFRVKPQ